VTTSLGNLLAKQISIGAQEALDIPMPEDFHHPCLKDKIFKE